MFSLRDPAVFCALRADINQVQEYDHLLRHRASEGSPVAPATSVEWRSGVFQCVYIYI